jgi:hypothetical protein
MSGGSDAVVTGVLLSVVALLACAVVCLAVYYIRQQCRRYLFSHSRALSELLVINERYRGRFYEYSDRFSYSAELDSKAKFDRFDAADYLSAIIQETLGTWEDVLNRSSSNCCNYQQYTDECNAALCSSPAPQKVPWFFFGAQRYRSQEIQQFNAQRLQPKRGIAVTVSWGYTSPAGRNSYADRERFDESDVAELIDEVRTRRKYESSAKHQRSLVTNSLRFKVFKRDGYRCQICGRTQKEGAKLVLDHIVPVAKGGKTELSNLQTLCFECNSGKSDRYM